MDDSELIQNTFTLVHTHHLHMSQKCYFAQTKKNKGKSLPTHTHTHRSWIP